MAGFTQAAVADALAHNQQNHPFTDVGSAITPTAGALWANITMHHAFVEAGDNVNPGSFFVQINLGATDESWTSVAQFAVVDEASIVTEQLTATEPAGETVLAVSSTTGFAAEDYIYVQDASVEVNSEWQQIQQIVTNTSIDILTPGLETQKDTLDFIWSDAETFTMRLELSGIARWRVVYMNEGVTAMNTAWWVRYIEVTGFGT